MVSGMCERRLEAIEDIIVVNSRDTTYDQEFQRRQVKLIAELYRDEDPKHSPAKDSFEKHNYILCIYATSFCPSVRK